MVRVKRGNVAKKRRKKILFLAKGFRGSHSKLFRIAHGQVLKALRYSYVGRKKKESKITSTLDYENKYYDARILFFKIFKLCIEIKSIKY